ncbi:MAG: hypothetical protein ACRDK2_12735 [Solirubrobacteraceae bacterium]
MSVSTEVQRTLVKSPPELWSELSDQDSLARHLADLGEIRITRTEPEQLVEWEAQQASGSVQIKASGWGTKVTLSVTRELPVDRVAEPQRPAQPEPELELASETTPEPLIEVEAQPEEIEPSPVAQTEIEQGLETEAKPSEPEPPTRAELEPEVETASEPTSSTQPRPGFFARLFKRRRACVTAAEAAGESAVSDPEPVLDQQPDPEPTLPLQALAAPQPIYPDPPANPAEAPADIVAELAAVEAQIGQDTTELLSSVLDRLGAAHHRPFSRA